MKKGTVIVAGISGVIVLGILTWQFILPRLVTDSRLEDAAIVARAKNLSDGYIFFDVNDWWGKPIVIRSFLTDDGTAYIYEAVSAGKDERYQSDDDLVCRKVDLNKSKIIGKYAGKKFKEAAKGFKEGLKEESKFEK